MDPARWVAGGEEAVTETEDVFYCSARLGDSPPRQLWLDQRSALADHVPKRADRADPSASASPPTPPTWFTRERFDLFALMPLVLVAVHVTRNHAPAPPLRGRLFLGPLPLAFGADSADTGLPVHVCAWLVPAHARQGRGVYVDALWRAKYPTLFRSRHVSAVDSDDDDDNNHSGHPTDPSCARDAWPAAAAARRETKLEEKQRAGVELASSLPAVVKDNDNDPSPPSFAESERGEIRAKEVLEVDLRAMGFAHGWNMETLVSCVTGWVRRTACLSPPCSIDRSIYLSISLSIFLSLYRNISIPGICAFRQSCCPGCATHWTASAPLRASPVHRVSSRSLRLDCLNMNMIKMFPLSVPSPSRFVALSRPETGDCTLPYFIPHQPARAPRLRASPRSTPQLCCCCCCWFF